MKLTKTTTKQKIKGIYNQIQQNNNTFCAIYLHFGCFYMFVTNQKLYNKYQISTTHYLVIRMNCLSLTLYFLSFNYVIRHFIFSIVYLCHL